MLHGHTKIDQVPVSDTGTGKTRPEKYPTRTRENFFFLGTTRTRLGRAGYVPDTAEGKEEKKHIQPPSFSYLSFPSQP